MKQVNPSDLYEVRLISLFGGLDVNYLLDLYEPLVGARAVAAYLTLSREKTGSMSAQHELLFVRLGLSAGEWYSAVEALEAVGLVRTFTKDGKGNTGFVYCLYAPKTPGEYFNNVLFAGTLRKTIGKDMCEVLADRYAVQGLPTGYDECTESFKDFFAFDSSDLSYLDSIIKTGSRLSGVAQIGFDRNLFYEALRKHNNSFSKSSFSEEELGKIERVATLYDYDEATIADFVEDHYSFSSAKDGRFDYPSFEADCSKSVGFAYLHHGIEEKKSVVDSDGDVSRMLKKMEAVSPIQYLRELQHNNKPAQADVELLNELTIEMGLPNSVTNVLITYVLSKNKNVLSRKLTEKIAASLVRGRIASALDAWNYLTETSVTKAKKKQVVPSATPNAPTSASSPSEETTASASESMSDEEFQKMIKELYEK